jgi:hypothetical protein
MTKHCISCEGHASHGVRKDPHTPRGGRHHAERLLPPPGYLTRLLVTDRTRNDKPPKDELIEKEVLALGLSLDQAFIQARRFPPDMLRDIATAVHAYRTFKRQEDDSR